MNLYEKKLPFEVFFRVNITDSSDGELTQISKDLGLALNLDEMKSIQRYFSKIKRKPTDVELQTIGQTWSEHCCHKTFKGDVVASNGSLILRSLMESYIVKATRELDLPWCLDVFSDNAGIVEFERDYALAIKVETHNHPSAIEPFGGAATGIGGVIRDILGVWAKPIACTDVLCFGPLDHPYDRLPPGSKHPRYLYKGVVAGIGHYGNNMGIPTVNGAIYFDEGYIGNVVVYCGCVGILHMDKFVRDTRPGDTAVLAGGKTGRDGIHGVTFASAELTEESEEVSRTSVQIANPIEEERLKRVILKIRDLGLASAITDLGGGGLSSAMGEMAHRSKCGIHVELEEVTIKDPTMTPWEIWISESQERMLLSVPKRNLSKVLALFNEEEVEAKHVGNFTGDKKLKVNFRGRVVADLDVDFLFKPPKAVRTARWTKPSFTEPAFSEPKDLTHVLFELLAAPNVASKEPVIRTYDHEVQGNTVLKPLHGKYGGPNDAAVLKPLPDSWRGAVLSSGIKPSYGRIDPYWMAASGIDEALRNNVAVGGRRVALLDNFVWGNPEKPERLGGLVRAVQACYDFAETFEAPFISGKDSLYNESPLGPVRSTLLITALGVIPDIRKAVSVDLKSAGNLVYVVGKTFHELGGSEYYRLKGLVGESVPKVRDGAKAIMNAITEAIDSGCVKACHDISDGGLAVAAAEMALAGERGVELHLRNAPKSEINRDDYLLFSETNTRFLVEISRKREEEFKTLMRRLPHSVIGKVVKSNSLCIYGLNAELIVKAGLSELRDAWKSAFRG